MAILPTPSSLVYGQFVGQFARIVADSTADANRSPDLIASTGTVTFTPEVQGDIKIAELKVTATPEAITCTLDDEGYLIDPTGVRGVFLVATNAPTEPSNITYRIDTLINSVRRTYTGITVFAGSTTDIYDVISVAPGSPVYLGNDALVANLLTDPDSEASGALADAVSDAITSYNVGSDFYIQLDGSRPVFMHYDNTDELPQEARMPLVVADKNVPNGVLGLDNDGNMSETALPDRLSATTLAANATAVNTSIATVDSRVTTVDGRVTNLTTRVDDVQKSTVPGRNYVPNGRFDNGTTGFASANAATIATSGTQSWVGAVSGLVSLGTATTDNGIRILNAAAGTFPDSVVVEAAVRVYLPSATAPATNPVKLLGATAIPGYPTMTTLKDQWVELRGNYTTTATGGLVFYVVSTNTTSGENFFIDDIRVFEGDFMGAWAPSPDETVNTWGTQTAAGTKTWSNPQTFMGPNRHPVTHITTNTTVNTSTYPHVGCNNTADITVTLFDAGTNSGYEMTVHRLNTGGVTVVPPAGGTIAGAASYVLPAQWHSVKFVSSGTAKNWYVGSVGSLTNPPVISDASTNTTSVWSSQKTSDTITSSVSAGVASVVDSAPATLNTLAEISNALGADANFATTITTALGNRVRFDGVQTLTTAQQDQARANVGSAAAATALRFDAQTLTTAEQTQARTNIGAASLTDVVTLSNTGRQTVVGTLDATGGLFSKNVEVVTLSATQSMTGKTLTSAILNGYRATTATISATGTLSSTTPTNLVTTSAAITLTLPTPSNGMHLLIKSTISSAPNITVVPQAAATIDGAASVSITTAYGYLVFTASSSNWFIIGRG